MAKFKIGQKVYIKSLKTTAKILQALDDKSYICLVHKGQIGKFKENDIRDNPSITILRPKH